MPRHRRRLLLALAFVIAGAGSARAQRPDLSGNYIRNGGTITFEGWVLTESGTRRLDAYDFMTDDPALRCVASSWARAWMNPNVVVRITQGEDVVRVQHEFMDLDRRIPIVDPTRADPPRGVIEGQPALGRWAAWYDGDTLVIESIDVGPGWVSTMDRWAGLAQSRRMRTIERLSVAGDLLTIEITHVDPVNYREPLVVTLTYPRSTFELMEYNCDPEIASVVAPQ